MLSSSSMTRPPPRSPLFPYTTLFRSVLLPRSKKALEFNADGTYDKKQWGQIAKESGPAARTGDSVQVTKILIESDRIVLEIRSEEHTSELQSHHDLVCRLLLEKKKKQ